MTLINETSLDVLKTLSFFFRAIIRSSDQIDQIRSNQTLTLF